MNKNAKKVLKKQRDYQLLSIISAVIGFILFIAARRVDSNWLNILGMLFCVVGGAYYLRTTAHIAALKAYDMAQDDASEGRGYLVIERLKDADIEKEDYLGD